MSKFTEVEEIIQEVRKELIKAGAVTEDTIEVTEILLTLTKWAFRQGVDCGKMLSDDEYKKMLQGCEKGTIN